MRAWTLFFAQSGLTVVGALASASVFNSYFDTRDYLMPIACGCLIASLACCVFGWKIQSNRIRAASLLLSAAALFVLCKTGSRLWFATATSSPDVLEFALSKAYRALDDKDYATAEHNYKLLLEAEKEGRFDMKQMESRNIDMSLGFALEKQGKLGEATIAYEHGVQRAESLGSKGNMQIVVPLHHLGRAYASAGRIQQAEAVFKRALSINEKNKASTGRHTWMFQQLENAILKDYAALLRASKREREAQKLDERIQRQTEIPVQ